MRVSVIVDPTALRAIARAVMGEDALDDAGQRDLLRELANTAGGALKRAYAAENISLTTGLPVDDEAPLPSETTRWWIGRAKDAGATLGFACLERSAQRLGGAAGRCRHAPDGDVGRARESRAR